MLAVQYDRVGPPEVLTPVRIDRPEPGPGQVLLKIESISVNYADTQLRKGTYPMPAQLPAIPGIEASARVVSAGPGVEDLAPGQAVIYFGQACYAEYAVADQKQVLPLPEGIDLDQAAALQVNYLTAYHLLHTQGKAMAGERILCYAAAGGVGTAAIQLAGLAGLAFIGLTSSPEKIAFAKEQGAGQLINYRETSPVDGVNEITGGQGVNLILDSVQGEHFHRNFDMLAPFGRLIWFGAAGGPASVDLMALVRAHAAKSPSVGAFNLYTLLSRPDLWHASLTKLVNYLADGSIAPAICERLPLAEAARAHVLLESGRTMGKIILKP